MRAGYGKSDITPDAGTQMVGYGYEMNRPVESVTDPLYCTCLSIMQEETLFFLFSFDLLRLSDQVIDDVRKSLQDRYGVFPQQVMMLATHTHTGPALDDSFGLGMADKQYVQELPERILAAAEKAFSDMRLVQGIRKVDQQIAPIGYNRAIPGGPEDHAVRGVTLVIKDGMDIAIVSYNCHPVTMGPKRTVSADYPGRVVRALEEEGIRAIYITGVCGDIDPIINKAQWGSGTEETITEYGRRIANGFIRGQKEPVSTTAFKYGIIRQSLPLERLDYSRIDAIVADAVANTQDSGFIRTVLGWAKVMRDGAGMAESEEGLTHYLCFDGFMIVAMNYEVFTALGDRIRAAIPQMLTIVAGNADKSLGYLPTAPKLKLGGYEALESVFLYLRSPVAQGGAEIYTDRMVSELIQELD